MVVQRRNYGEPINFGRAAFSGFSPHRYGEGRRQSQVRMPALTIQKKQPPPALSKPKRDAAVAKLASMFKSAEPSPWAFEGPARAGIREALVQSGFGWMRSDLEAERLIASAFAAIGKTTRPDWEEGQRYTTIGPDFCVRCLGPLDDEDRANNRRFCSAECARAAQVRFDFETGYYQSSLGWHAGYIIRLERAEVRQCLVCSSPFKATRPDTVTCSKHCAAVLNARDLAPRGCQNCGTAFSPNHETQLFCGERCNRLTKEQRKKKRRHQAIAEQPERICENQKCGKPFRPLRVGKKSDRFCCNSCRRAAAYQRLKGKRPIHPKQE